MRWAFYYNKLFLLKTKSRVYAVMEIQEQLRQECPKRVWPEFQKRSWAEFQKRSWAEFQKQSWAEWIPAVPIHKRKSFLQRKWQFIDKMCRFYIDILTKYWKMHRISTKQFTSYKQTL